jgi:hypothetical protein
MVQFGQLFIERSNRIFKHLAVLWHPGAFEVSYGARPRECQSAPALLAQKLFLGTWRTD